MIDQTYLSENIIEIYKKHGHAWTELRGEYLYEQAWLDRFLALLPQNSNILDLGCGSGKPIAQYLIEKGHKVTGVDASDCMITMAQQNFSSHSFSNLHWINADMRTLELKQKFQGMIAWDSFFHLTPNDQRTMFQQFTKFSEQGTALMFTSGPAHGEAVGDLFGDALYHASLSLEEYRELFQIYGFEEVLMIAEDQDCTGHTVWLVRKIRD
ncbi:class I SAM-dependent methyltransferase [Acinetobacter wuhouensis]|uniref:class I SAM-dependent DNA methyltransferase n=1 Tax=Acinetobacter wuhouensis TaxID=1879050 RepID=UPI00083AE44D|nr:class I SAM-dependent methyltransferase [Acinetobacter wuhouensis]AXQ21210.1 class I SAM-dependent methyltransferase [Acinetobacter wuhouensis]